MRKLVKYDNTTVKVTCKNGEVITGACVWDSPDYNYHEYGVDEESLRIGEYVIYRSLIRKIELIRAEACIPVRDWPEAREEIIEWFADRWGLPVDIYRKSITACIGTEGGIPQWYVAIHGSRIVAGCGVIENDFHERKDLTPNVCAVYVDEDFRGQGLAGFLLQFVCDDMAALGYDTLYLLTDHAGFYEKYGWEYLYAVRGDDGCLSRMYVHRSKKNSDESTAPAKETS
ncbi:MAG: GNAT family N-acetyltransferase [Clostridia bacterium]|nr:GNAT family N-acetyltransferase [Clostridia bacterium]